MPSSDKSKPSDYDDPNDWYVLQFGDVRERLMKRGLNQSDASVRAFKLLAESISNVAGAHADAIETTGRSYLTEMAEYRSGFKERLKVHWGEPLDLYELMVSVVEDGGVRFARRNLRVDKTYSQQLDVLVQLNGQTIRVAREIHALLSAGFPLGAQALARTIHEISVRAGVLSAFGASEEHVDLAERLVLHDRVINFRDAKVYQRDADRLGYEPFSDNAMARMKADHDEVLERFGNSFGGQYGWAVGLPKLPKPKNPSFADLESLANLDHFRGFYAWSSHFIHNDSKALRLGRLERGGVSAVLTNATNNMLADPAQHALIGLVRVFTSMTTAAKPFAFVDMLLCESLALLLDKVEGMFVDAERAVDEAEGRLQEGYRTQGQALTPYGPIDLAMSEAPNEGRSASSED